MKRYSLKMCDIMVSLSCSNIVTLSNIPKPELSEATNYKEGTYKTMKTLLRNLLVAGTCMSISASAATISFDSTKTGSVLQPQHLAGTCLPIWNTATIYKQIQPGLKQGNFRLFRFPNGSLSNGYHWNGSGSYTADSIWIPDSQTYTPGFMSMTLRRGTSVSNWGFDSYSNVTDGDTLSYWRSDELIAASDPYCYLELSKAAAIDSVKIYWGERHAVDFNVEMFSLANCPYPGPFGHDSSYWVVLDSVRGNSDAVTSIKFSEAKSTRYVRVIAKKFKADTKSVEVAEVLLFAQGTQVSKNVKKYTGGGSDNQTRVIAMPTFIGNTLRPNTNWKTWHFDAFMEYIDSVSTASIPLVCVNYSTGTPEEAAAWVRYANIVQKYAIKYWEIGNELDGAWEDGGPITAAMYAEKYLQFAKAMKAVDSSIKLFGPLQSSAAFDMGNSGLYDGKSWMRVFIEILGKAEKEDGKKYCDGIDFHSYPYWASSPVLSGLVNSADYLYGQVDSLRGWIDSSLTSPESTFVMMSEFNSMTILCDLLQKPVNGLYVANMLAGFSQKFGSRAMSIFWDSFEEGDVGSNGTFGSLSLFNTLTAWNKSTLIKPPSSAYWALYMVNNLWIDNEKACRIVPAVRDSATLVRAYGLSTPDDYRILAFNFGAAKDSVVIDLPGKSYKIAEVFTWGEAEFKWNGTDKKAYAFPSCGPSSKRITTSNLESVVIPAYSMCVVQLRDTVTPKGSPRFLHLMSAANAGSSSSYKVPLCGTFSGAGETVKAVEYTFDSAAGFASSLASLDGAFDGTIENFSDSIACTGLTTGMHTIFIRATTASGTTVLDSAKFNLSEVAVRPDAERGSRSASNITELRQPGRIQITFSEKMTGSSNVSARVFTLNGSCIATMQANKMGQIEWSGESAMGQKVPAGLYFVMVYADGAIIHRTSVAMGK